MKKNFKISLYSILFFTNIFGNSEIQDKISNDFILVTTIFNETNPYRLSEYITCFERNVNHSLISRIHVLYDTSNDDAENVLLNYLKSKSKIVISYIPCRPSYQYIFDLCNEKYSDKSIILSNADIYFNETLSLLKEYDLTNKFLSLTRWEAFPNGAIVANHEMLADGVYGADTWIFNAPIKKFIDSDFQMGTCGCDGRIIHQADRVGLDMLNPCIEIVCTHVHCSQIRRYNKTEPWQAMSWLKAGLLKDGKSKAILIQNDLR